MRKLIFTVCITFGLMAILYSQTPNLVAAWPMTNGMDVSGLGHNLTFTGTTAVPGKYSTAQQFNGTNGRGTTPGVVLTDRFTLEAWVYFTQATNVTRAVQGLRQGPRATNGWQAIIYRGQDNYFLATSNGFLTAGLTTALGFKQITAPTQLEYNKWIHVATTFTSANLYLMINGAIVAGTSVGGVTSIVAVNSPTEIGGSQADGGWVSGMIDDVRIYNRDLTAPEVVVDMNTPSDLPHESVVSWDLEVWPPGQTPSNGGAVAISNFPKATASCNLAPVTPPTGVIVNPTHFRVTDPEVTGKECEVTATEFFLTVPLGTGYGSTVKARGATTVSDRSTLSNLFDRTAEATPPNTPNKPTNLQK